MMEEHVFLPASRRIVLLHISSPSQDGARASVFDGTGQKTLKLKLPTCTSSHYLASQVVHPILSTEVHSTVLTESGPGHWQPWL